jgi:hypothetical protein
MHTLTIQTKYTLGERVRLNPRVRAGGVKGTIVGIVVYQRGPLNHAYLIEVDGDPYVQSILREDQFTCRKAR